MQKFKCNAVKQTVKKKVELLYWLCDVCKLEKDLRENIVFKINWEEFKNVIKVNVDTFLTFVSGEGKSEWQSRL